MQGKSHPVISQWAQVFPKSMYDLYPIPSLTDAKLGLIKYTR